MHRVAHEHLADTETHCQPKHILHKMRASNLANTVVGLNTRASHASGVHVDDHRDVGRLRIGRSLIDADLGDPGQQLLRPRHVDMVMDQPPQSLIRHTEQACRCQHRHLLDQLQSESLEQQGEAHLGTSPRHTDQSHAMLRARHPRHPRSQMRRVLPKTQVLPLAFGRIVPRTGLPALRTTQARSLIARKYQTEAVFHIEVRRGNTPRGLESQALGKKLNWGHGHIIPSPSPRRHLLGQW